jgi:hypothetical protein
MQNTSIYISKNHKKSSLMRAFFLYSCSQVY